MTLELSNWFWEGVLMKGGVLSIDRAYFDITGGRERWLYRVARKHAGGAGPNGFAISMPVLFDKSGAEGEYRRFKFEVLKLAEKNDLPGYRLAVEEGRGAEPLLRMVRVTDPNSSAPDGDLSQSADHASPEPDESEQRCAIVVKDSAAAPTRASKEEPLPAIDARSLVRSAVAGLSDKATRGLMTDETVSYLREKCPGWDLYALHAEFEAWVKADPNRTPANWQKAFIGWVKRHHEKHKHELRR
jgi:plasmid replication initiation protein